jgi:hypothetical protein
MNAVIRWGKFNLVGAMGMVVQLAAVAAINRCAPGHYLVRHGCGHRDCGAA